MPKGKSERLKVVEREARRLERLCKLRLVEQPPPKISTQPTFQYEPKDAA